MKSKMTALFAILMIFLFLRNWRPSIIIAFTIPLSILLTFAGLVAAGYTFNMMTLAAIALGIGMLVDNAVVVIENIYRRMERENEDRFTASAKGTNQVVLAITASTFTTIVVFLPMALAAGITGRLVRPLAFTITFALLASLFMAVTFVPMMASKLFKKREEGQKVKKTGKIMRVVVNVYGKILHFVLIHVLFFTIPMCVYLQKDDSELIIDKIVYDKEDKFISLADISKDVNVIRWNSTTFKIYLSK